MATKKSSTRKGRGKVKKVMHEYKHGELKSGSGKSVKSRKQAVAIALNEAREEGANIPRKGASKKSASKKTSSRPSSKKSAGRKSTSKKSTAKKRTSKRTSKKSS